MAKGRAGGLLKCARLLRPMLRTDSAMAAGRLTVDHVRLLACAHRANADAFAADEERLIATAERCLFSAFERVIHYWTHAHAPDDAEAAAATLHEQRRLDASRSMGLTTQLNGRCYCPFHHRWHHRQAEPAA